MDHSPPGMPVAGRRLLRCRECGLTAMVTDGTPCASCGAALVAHPEGPTAPAPPSSAGRSPWSRRCDLAFALGLAALLAARWAYLPALLLALAAVVTAFRIPRRDLPRYDRRLRIAALVLSVIPVAGGVLGAATAILALGAG